MPKVRVVIDQVETRRLIYERELTPEEFDHISLGSIIDSIDFYGKLVEDSGDKSYHSEWKKVEVT